MNGNIDWGLVFTALLAVFGFIGLLMEYYYRVHRPRAKDKEQKRGEIYKPLMNNVDALIEGVKEKKKFGDIFNWKTVEDKVSIHLYAKLERLFQDKVDNYNKLLQHNQNFIRYFGYFYLKSNLPELEEEFKNLGVGALEYELYESIVIPILNGEEITLKWLEDNRPQLFENLTKCSSYKKLKNLLQWLNEENPCIETLRKIEQDLLQTAKELKKELKSF